MLRIMEKIPVFVGMGITLEKANQLALEAWAWMGKARDISLGTSLHFFPVVALGIFSQTPVPIPPWWGRFP